MRKYVDAVRMAWSSRLAPVVFLSTTVVCGVGWRMELAPLAAVWGTVASWVAALGTLVAVSVSLYLANSATDRLHEERMRDQACKLSWWISDFQEGPRLPEGIRLFVGEAHAHLHGFDWQSDDNLCDATGFYVVKIHNTGDSAFASGSLWSTYEAGPSVKTIGMIPPGETVVSVPVIYGGTPLGSAKLSANLGLNPGVAWIEYQDVDGRYWRRLASGALECRPGHLSDVPNGR